MNVTPKLRQVIYGFNEKPKLPPEEYFPLGPHRITPKGELCAAICSSCCFPRHNPDCGLCAHMAENVGKEIYPDYVRRIEKGWASLK